MASRQPDRPEQPHARGDRTAGGGMTDDTAAGGTIDDEDTGGAARAAERSAQRAAAVAAAEGFHPLRLRPYVGEPGDGADGTGEAGDTGRSTVRRLIDADGSDPAADGGPATADLGLFPAAYSGLEYAPEDGADARAAAHAHAVAAARGRHRRRRRGIVVAAAAVAASALAAGAVAVTGQIMGDEQGATDRAMPDRSTSMPDVTLPSDATQSTASSAPAMTRTAASPSATPSGTPSTSARATVSPAPPVPASHGSVVATAGTTVPDASTASANDDAATVPPAGSGPAQDAQPPAPPADAGTPASAQVLQLGDSGPAVAELQRRLEQVWVYSGPVDGVFDKRVQLAVATFQVWHWVSDASDGSRDGVYGPKTRAALESRTRAS